MDTYRLGILISHPIQYFAPLYRQLAEHPRLDPVVFYCSRKGLESYSDEGFGGVEIQWDTPLMDGYEYRFMDNWMEHREDAWDFWSLLNPGIVARVFSEQLDGLVLHGYNSPTHLLAVAAANVAGVPLMLRSDAQLQGQTGLLKGLLRPAALTTLYALFDGFLAAGTKNAEYYRAFGASEEQIWLAPFSVDNAYFRSQLLDEQEQGEFRADEGLEEGVPVILFASKMTERKRAMDLLKAYETLGKRGVEAQLALVGDGVERAKLEAYVEEHAIEGVHFPGFINQSQLPKWYSIADVFVLPSENEPWGLVINEVMNAGIPVVSTWDAGVTYDLVIPGETGYGYEAGDVEALGGILERIVGDEEHRRRLGEGARERIDNWGIEETVEGYVRAVEGIRETGAN